jgi:hypothetical protein
VLTLTGSTKRLSKTKSKYMFTSFEMRHIECYFNHLNLQLKTAFY